MLVGRRPRRQSSPRGQVAQYNVQAACGLAPTGGPMLPHTFCHLPGVGPVSERRLWQAGYTLWQQLLDSALPPPTGAVRDAGLAVQESIDRFGRRDFAYFGGCLPAGERWRLFHEARPSCVYLDIETTGLGMFADITTVALYDGCRLRTFVAGRDLDGVP